VDNPSIFFALGAAFFASIIALGLWTGKMLSGRGSFDKQQNPVAFAVSGCLWGVCCLICLLFAAITLLPDD